MIVKVTYDDQRLDVFDTNTFTGATPLGKDIMLANFEVRFDAMEGGELWLTAHGYKIDPSYKGDEGTPVARRKEGWRFLLVEAAEMDHVMLVVVDGEAIVKRVLGELMDLQAFDEAAYECIGTSSKGLRERIVELHEYLLASSDGQETRVPGVPEEVLQAVLEQAKSRSGAGGDEEDWGDMNEAGW